MRVPLSEIAFDAGTQVRASISEAVVSEYAERMAEGAEFPPVVLFHDGNRHYLADGFHRFMAARRNQFHDIAAEVRPGTKTDALWFALGANKANGQRLTEQDKQHAVEIALRMWPEKMQREIAQQVGCSESLVSKVALKFASNTGVEGELRGRALLNHKKREQIREMVAAGAQSIEIRDQLRAHPSVIAEVRAEMGLSKTDKSKAAVAQRRKDIRDMAERGFSTRQIAASVGIGEQAIGDIAKAEGIVIHADRVIARTKRIDSNRIVEQMALQAESLIADVELIDFAALDRERIAVWLKSLKSSRDALGAFVRRLMKEQQEHVEVA